ncbi:MAG: sugar transferase, partial [Acetobacteraceae bacterium]
MFTAQTSDAAPAPPPVAGAEPLHLSLAPAGAGPLPLEAGDALHRPAPVVRRTDGLGALLKRLIDVLGAAALLVALAPFMAVIALLVARDGGPVFYSHQRVGRGGTLFGCLKFRSMVVDAEARLAALLERDPMARAEWEATRKLRDDPRITPVGRFLRATSLDELPQLFNVLAGQMSLVGPRPVQQGELAQFYGVAAAHYRAVRPGLTGPWQISGRNDTSYAQRVALDVAYVERATVLTDLAILLRTPSR